ncbi:phospholipase A2 inhibitor and Ly6/PLAUR domain-containing protein-like [Micropterus dolomieu]|uniref:phospholipase A2 inhibitor and Ly6/PLAUR domain-containing protein-like n=1 Tax=Micropterus dolomieu TaxID=147949 RepID=UPI001E8DE85D|nr:phospholipase A2 inhibitor and Ly6/PLAUR domain-containing protein-like [Micropterus dolomieu]XP_045899126.1 phospholipase A2 inhibitor and Ly6/PLAUR domain-containing protein-like [Micropterus dolomieu]XP_045899127.1 phospholipase A2 inhibitor and Ly6/PLAUR domain-containing protein-like [Micropterus dolomieu]
MMKPILSLTLIWALSSTAGALQCQSCQNDQCTNPPSLPCSSQTMCVTATFQVSTSGVTVPQIIKACAPSSVCPATGPQTFSFNAGVAQIVASLQCCNTDNCNTETLPKPVPQPNSLKCFTCDPLISHCNSSQLQCKGAEDRCFKVNVTTGGNTSPFSGCASANLCALGDSLSSLPVLQGFGSFSTPSCCGTSLCNAVTRTASDAGCMSLLLGVLIFTLRFFEA